MSEHNGSAKSPTKVVVRNVADLAHDAVTIAELQAELLRTELRQSFGAAVTPLVLMVVASLVIVGCVPVLMLALAFLLAESTGLSQALSTMIVVLVGFVGAGVSAWVGLRQLQNKTLVLERSRAEFNRNVTWIKQALKVISGIRDTETPTMASRAHSRQTADR